MPVARALSALAVVAVFWLLTACAQPLPESSASPQEAATPMSTTTLNIAHRGARSLAPENTLAAARKTLEIGADLWELDVAMTGGGIFTDFPQRLKPLLAREP